MFVDYWQAAKPHSIMEFNIHKAAFVETLKITLDSDKPIIERKMWELWELLILHEVLYFAFSVQTVPCFKIVKTCNHGNIIKNDYSQFIL